MNLKKIKAEDIKKDDVITRCTIALTTEKDGGAVEERLVVIGTWKVDSIKRFKKTMRLEMTGLEKQGKNLFKIGNSNEVYVLEKGYEDYVKDKKKEDFVN